ncbi:hypothetical protein Vretifemale_19059 [Volvox reticuliferus]|nr:hypothetical protein Vretifemale_19059 [Volvox reticuliferus]
MDPSSSAIAAAGGGGGSNGAGGGGGLERGGSYNPFLSPSATYVNPFLDLPPRTVAATTAAGGGGGGGGGGGDHNPFLVPMEAAAAVNPFLNHPPSDVTGAGPCQRHAASNPFLSPRVSEQENPFLTEGKVAAGVEGRALATRVLTRLGTHGSVSMTPGAGSDGGDGGDAGDRGGDGGSSGSGTGVYVSSRSTADEADLVTDIDLRLVDFMLKKLGMDDDGADFITNTNTADADADADVAPPSSHNSAPSDEFFPHGSLVRQAAPCGEFQGEGWPLADSRLESTTAAAAGSGSGSGGGSGSGTWGAVVRQRAKEPAGGGPDELPYGQQNAHLNGYGHSQGYGGGDGSGEGGAAGEGNDLGSKLVEEVEEWMCSRSRQQESGPRCWGQGGGGFGEALAGSDSAREARPDCTSETEAPAANPFL